MSSCNGGPFFSICVASYNAARYIGECLESIACQSFKDYEVVLVDDGSTDGTADVVDSVAYMFEPGVLRSFRSPDNRGTYETRLDLIRRSLGDYILFLDSDDMYALDCRDAGRTSATRKIFIERNLCGPQQTIDRGHILHAGCHTQDLELLSRNLQNYGFFLGFGSRNLDTIPIDADLDTIHVGNGVQYFPVAQINQRNPVRTPFLPRHLMGTVFCWHNTDIS